MRLLPQLANKPKLIRIASLIASFIVLIAGTNQALAQWYEPTPRQHTEALQQCDNGNVGLECTVQAITTAIINSTNYGAGGGTGGNTGVPGSQRPGAIFVATNLITTLIANPPVSGGQYAEYVAQKLNLVEPAYAQGGTGFQALNDYIPIWTAFRNIAYLAYVVIFLFVGFMIMFRAKLDPQTVVSIQTALPNLVITLILITFSYAIAGFMVDLIYLGIFLIITTFASQGFINDPAQATNDMINQNIFQIFSIGSIFRISTNLGDFIGRILTDALSTTGVLGKITDWLGSAIGTIILTVAILFSIFRVFFQLVIAFIQIVILTIFSPIMILFNALPGSTSFSNWARNLLSNIIVYPTVATLILISAILMGQCQDCANYQDWGIQGGGVADDNEAWLPPFVATFDSFTPEAIQAMIGLGIILIMPQMISSIQQAFKAKPLPTAGVFAPIMAGSRVATALPRAAYGTVSSMAKTYVAQKTEMMAGEGRRT